MTGAGPGTSPQPNPMPVPRRMARAERRRSARVGNRSFKRGTTTVPSSRSAGLATFDSTSPIPKIPIATATNSIPLKSDMEPKVKRASPVTGSRPIVPTIRPTSAIISDLTSEPPVTLLRTINPNTMSEKYSAGPKTSAARARGGAHKTSPKIPIVPATKDPMAQIASAGPALPFWAMR